MNIAWSRFSTRERDEGSLSWEVRVVLQWIEIERPRIRRHGQRWESTSGPAGWPGGDHLHFRKDFQLHLGHQRRLLELRAPELLHAQGHASAHNRGYWDDGQHGADRRGRHDARRWRGGLRCNDDFGQHFGHRWRERFVHHLTSVVEVPRWPGILVLDVLLVPIGAARADRRRWPFQRGRCDLELGQDFEIFVSHASCAVLSCDGPTPSQRRCPCGGPYASSSCVAWCARSRARSGG